MVFLYVKNIRICISLVVYTIYTLVYRKLPSLFLLAPNITRWYDLQYKNKHLYRAADSFTRSMWSPSVFFGQGWGTPCFENVLQIVGNCEPETRQLCQLTISFLWPPPLCRVCYSLTHSTYVGVICICDCVRTMCAFSITVNAAQLPKFGNKLTLFSNQWGPVFIFANGNGSSIASCLTGFRRYMM